MLHAHAYGMYCRYLRFWRAGARALHFERLKAKVGSRMFMAKPDFCYAIMEIGAKAHELRNTLLLDLPAKPAVLSEVTAAQEELRK